MKVLITGADGFIGRNFVEHLQTLPEVEIIKLSHLEPLEIRQTKCKEADIFFHFAGVSRPKDPAEFHTSIVDYLSSLLSILSKRAVPCPVVFTSSIQAAMEPPYGETEYGRAKRAAEDLLLEYGKQTGARTVIYRLPHTFGPYGQPDYNNVVHTFCHHIANGIPVRIDHPDAELSLLYVKDLVASFDADLFSATHSGIVALQPLYRMSLGKLAELLLQFKADSAASPENLFQVKLYDTFQTYYAV